MAFGECRPLPGQVVHSSIICKSPNLTVNIIVCSHEVQTFFPHISGGVHCKQFMFGCE